MRGEIYFFIIFSSKCCKSLNCVTNSLSSYNFCVLCSVWTLFSSLSWDLPALVCHPVDKMGTFTLIPRAYGIVHLRQTVTWHYVCLITVLLQHLCVCSWWSFMKWRRGFIQGRLSMLTNSYWWIQDWLNCRAAWELESRINVNCPQPVVERNFTQTQYTFFLFML